ncbi:hypothetical protein [Natrinema longum]|uniref:Uncharacterized protein n=1 Tax=Natrinema longum TaxID=370324 RepID=A0A8A2UDF5_9EURY|nr:hypothetical protein [Natrinema longum]MBZ6495350.1 hypothetical protein [Natrinema longum]QSW86677.1 hypothetical protein J0X27_07655 [Natrinema longum]
MNRRRLLRTSGRGLAIAVGGLAGCLGSDDETPPPRESVVFDDVSITDGTMEIDLVSEPKVESRDENVDAAAVGSLVPVGTARAGSRSSSSRPSGATGRGSGGHSSAPKGRHGWAIYGGTSGHHWRDDHEDDIRMYRASIAALGVAYMGSNTKYQAMSPGPDPADWEREWSEPEPGTTVEADLAAIASEPRSESTSSVANESVSPTANESASDPASSAREGWYRVGTRLESPDGDTDFEWQAADFRLERASDGLAVDEAWHVRPRV